jgi:hypothetical protein
MVFPTDGPKTVGDMTEFKALVGGTQGEGRSLHVMGWIEYTDDGARNRRIGFCRKYDFEARRFQRVSAEDYEYED